MNYCERHFKFVMFSLINDDFLGFAENRFGPVDGFSADVFRAFNGLAADVFAALVAFSADVFAALICLSADVFAAAICLSADVFRAADYAAHRTFASDGCLLSLRGSRLSDENDRKYHCQHER